MQPPSPTPPLPPWAVDHARAWLDVGYTVPEVESRLVGRGLDPRLVTAVINHILESRIKERTNRLADPELVETIHRVASALVACVALALAYGFGMGLSVGKTAIWLVGPICCIWFPDVMGRTANVEKSVEIRWFGWSLVVLIVGYRAFLYFMIKG